jgi:Mg-chelatase subunit ChlD
MNSLSLRLSAVIAQAAQLPDTGLANNFKQRIGSGNPDVSILLLDTSGSMGYDCKGRQTRLDVLRQAVEDLNWQSFQMFTFDNICKRIKTPAELNYCAGGSTNLTMGLKKITALQPSQTIVISDGQPSDEETSIAVAKELTGTISTIFIGDDDDKEAIAFMKKLASLGCGRTYIQNLGYGHAELSATIARLALPPAK